MGHDAGITQLVECNLPKVEVAGSSPVSRSQNSQKFRDVEKRRVSRSVPLTPRVLPRVLPFAGSQVVSHHQLHHRHAGGVSFSLVDTGVDLLRVVGSPSGE